GEPCWMEGDPTRLQQIVSNLLNNAARYTPGGGEIDLVLERDGTEVLLRVRDSGIGIEPRLRERVFEPFVQAGRVPGSVHEGLGLGLTLVKELVELHGGTVAVESDGPGLGSEFVVRLPLDRARAAVPSAAAPAAAPPSRAKRVLVVDDNVDSADTLARLLSLDGHQIEVAHDGRDALDKFRALRPDVVLMDIELPGD